ncbi:MAG: NAD(P)-dependent glycerol-3-phosphate dehydrogenase [Oscillospiraceae bacterium]|nr:NAD(P)-dependent glycerol-3-phosphate dehydrogenase [Oscillospiraceae bacterium]
MKKIGVLGAGTWGMALARMLANSGHSVTVWSAIEKEIDEFSATRRHPNLPGMEIPEQVAFTKDIKGVCEGMDILLFAVPSPFVRSTARKAAPYVRGGQIVVDVAKGMEADTLCTMTQIIAQELQNSEVKLVALSGPTHAEEVARDLPTTIVSSCEDLAVAELVQEVFTSSCMRVYTNDDVLGVELCGAMKNVIALAAGIAAGLGYGDNAKAALITRGIAEIARLGTAMGCKEQTFGGLAGVGDLIVTATSVHSRNNRCGILLGQGVSPEEAVKQVGMVVEGINALPAAMHLKRQYGVEMPIVETVDAVVNGKMPVSQAVNILMARDYKPELPVSALENRY